MKATLLKALSIERSEASGVSILLLQSFFIGIFYAVFEIAANALFLNEIGQDRIAEAFMVSGVVGIVMTGFYSALQSRINFKWVSIINLLIIALITVVLYLGFGAGFNNHYLIYAVFVMVGPLKILAIVGFWGVAARVFNLRQGKRLFGMLDTGMVFGVILLGVGIPLIQKFLPQTHDLFLISAMSVCGAAFMQFFVNRLMPAKTKEEVLNEKKVKSSAKAGEKVGFFDLFKSKYTFLMTLFVAVSMISAFFVHFSFLTVTKDKYPDPVDMANFLGVFTAVMNIFIFSIKTFLYSKLMNTYGLKITLMVLPVILGIFTVLAAFLGTFFGYNNESSGFIVFFLIIAVSKLFAESLKIGIEAPAFKVLYQPIDVRRRYDIQSRIDGTVNETAALTAGILLTLLSLFNFITLLHFTYILVVIIALWLVVSTKLYAEYRNTLQQTLDMFKNIAVSSRNAIKSAAGVSENLIREYVLKNFSLKDGLTYAGNYLRQALLSDEANLRSGALECIEREKALHLTPFIAEMAQNEPSQLLKNRAQSFVNEAEASRLLYSDAERLRELFKSKNADDRVMAVKLSLLMNDPAKALPVMDLLKDIKPDVRLAAIDCVKQLKMYDGARLLAENLGDRRYAAAAAQALVALGHPVNDALNQRFRQSDTDNDTAKRIINVWGLIKHPDSVALLLDKLTHPNPGIVREAIIALKNADYKASGATQRFFVQALESAAADTAWNFNALYDLKRSDKVPAYLINAMEREYRRSYDFLFTVLSLAYDAGTIDRIKENIDSATPDGIGFAIELLDLLLDEHLKPILLPIFDDMDPAEKIAVLETQFPIVQVSAEETLRDLLNRDVNRITFATKVAVMRALEEKKLSCPAQTLSAQVFNSHPMLKESAAYVLKLNHPKAYADCLERLPSNFAFFLDRKLTAVIEGQSLTFSALFIAMREADAAGLVNDDILEEMVIRAGHISALPGLTVPVPPDAVFFFNTGNKPVRFTGGDTAIEVGTLNFFNLPAYQKSPVLEADAPAMLLMWKNSDFNDLAEHFPEFPDSIAALSYAFKNVESAILVD